MTLNIATKNWLTINAGTGNCFISNGVSYIDPDNIPRSGGTGDVINAFFVAHLLGKDTQTIIASTNYNNLKVINNNSDISLNDVSWVYSNDGNPEDEPQYCITVPTLTSIRISPTTATINIDETKQLTNVCKDQNGDVMTCGSLIWTSLNDSIASVDLTGLVTGVSEGSTNITASYEGITSNTSTITVSKTKELGTNPVFIASGLGLLYILSKITSR